MATNYLNLSIFFNLCFCCILECNNLTLKPKICNYDANFLDEEIALVKIIIGYFGNFFNNANKYISL